MKNDYRLTEMDCPLCNSQTVYEQYDISHKEEGCLKCGICGDAIFEFARRVKDSSEKKNIAHYEDGRADGRKEGGRELKKRLLKHKKFSAYIWFEKGDKGTGKTILDLVKEAIAEAYKK